MPRKTSIGIGPRPLCECGNLVAFVARSKNGYRTYRKKCISCCRKPYKLAKGSRCDQCQFVPVHPCQLDVDHIDGNHKNNDPKNLRTLCANCHRLVTHVQRMQKWAPEHAR